MKTAQLLPVILLLLCGAALVWILLPFFSAILWGVILALLLLPTYRRLLLKMRHRHNAAAAIVLLGVVLMGVLPFALLTTALASQASDIYRMVDAGEWKVADLVRSLFERLPDWLVSVLQQLGIGNGDVLMRRLNTALAEGSQWVATQALSIGLNTFGFASSLGVALYLGYYFLRDGQQISHSFWRAVPLLPAQKEEFRSRFAAVVRATIKGGVSIALIQGALGGLAFWYLEVKGALLWAMVMALASLLPVIGTALVWLPVTLYLLLAGDGWKALQLAVFSVAVIGLTDNLLRPMLVGRNTQMPDYVVMITTLGGIAVFGLNGIVIGPLIAAMFFAAWHMNLETPAENTGKPAPGGSADDRS